MVTGRQPFQNYKHYDELKYNKRQNDFNVSYNDEDKIIMDKVLNKE